METLEAVELKESKARRHPDNNLDFDRVWNWIFSS